MSTGNSSKTPRPARSPLRDTSTPAPAILGPDGEPIIRSSISATQDSSLSGVVAVSIVDASPNLDTQQTVISKGTPVATPPLGQVNLPPAEMGKVLLGIQLGHYELQEFVGGGGMGAVFRAHDTMLERTVAVKVLSKSQSSDEETLRRFKNEAQSAARLDHENIGRVHYVGEDKGWHYIVFEYIEGVNLRDLVEQEGPLSLERMVSFTLQVADALAHAAHRDVVHRDIKPSNVLVTPEGKAKLVDMGLARLHQVEHSAADLTASGVTLGTFDYISPEQARDPRNADVRSDIYSLGCTVYFMLTGRPPFVGGTVLQKLLQHQSDEPPDPRELRPDLPEEISRIERRMLAKAPAQRYQRPEDLMADLLALAERFNLAPPTTIALLTRKTVPIRQRLVWRQLPWAVPVGILLLVAAVMAVVGRAQRDEAAPPPIRRLASSGGVKSASVETRPSAVKRGDTTPKSPNATLPNDNSANKASSPRPPRSPAEGSTSPSTGLSTGATAAGVSTAPLSDVAHVWRRQLQAALHPSFRHWSPSLAPAIPLAPPVVGSQTQDSTTATVGDQPAPADRKGVLVVNPARQSPGEFATVADACRAAKSGDVIEIRYTGVIDERPLSLTSSRLTIRAAEGFSPVIRFQPTPAELSQPRGMIALGGNQLTLIGIELQLDVPRKTVMDWWAMLELRSGDSLRMENCTVTLSNASDAGDAYHANVAMFDIRGAANSAGSSTKDSAPPRTPVLVQLKNCVLRGEATVVHAADAQAFQFSVENGLVATSERFLAAGGGPVDSKPQGANQLGLRHVTAYTPSGFALLSTSQDAPVMLPIELNVSESILLCKTGRPLIEQSGPDESDDLRKKLTWMGERNFYEGFGALWRIVGSLGADASTDMTLSDWQAYWGAKEIQPSVDQVAWKSFPGKDQAPHEQSPSDFALMRGGNPAHNSAGDGRDAGFEADQLPQLGQ